VAAATASLLVASVGSGAGAATDPTVSVSTRVLVLDDGTPMVGALTDRLDKEGLPHTRIDLTSGTRPTITSSLLVTQSASSLTARFGGVVFPSEAPAELSVTELSLLRAYEKAFGVREVDAYTWAHPEVGLSQVGEGGYAGPVDGFRARVTGAGTAGAFRYLRGELALDDISPDVTESWGNLSTALPSDPRGGVFTPLVTATVPGTDTDGSLIGQYAVDGREQLVITFASHAPPTHWKLLGHGIVTWLTRGVSTSNYRNAFSVHVDDVFLPDARWDEDGNCTVGSDCAVAAYDTGEADSAIRMTPSDVSALRSWQGTNSFKLDLAFNGHGSVEAQQRTGAADPLTTELLRAPAQFRWINHTYRHPYLGCRKNEATTPWTCAKDAGGQTIWTSRQVIGEEVASNLWFALTRLIPLNPGELVTGEHSGLKALPQAPTDNPNLAPALTDRAVRWIGSDASRERDPRVIGSATTVPRHPMNIFYNTGTKQEAADEYSWVYGSTAAGGSGLCEAHPEKTTCMAPLSRSDGFDSYIVPLESRIAFGHVVDNDARPHYAHQSNLAEDRILYPVLDRVLSRYRSTFTDSTPLLNPSMSQAGQQLADLSTWSSSSGVEQYVSGNLVTVRNGGSRTVKVPVTLPAGSRSLTYLFGWPFVGGVVGIQYAAQQSTWVSLAGGMTATYLLPSAVGYKSPTSWDPTPPPAPATPDEQPGTLTTDVTGTGTGLAPFVEEAPPVGDQQDLSSGTTTATPSSPTPSSPTPSISEPTATATETATATGTATTGPSDTPSATASGS